MKKEKGLKQKYSKINKKHVHLNKRVITGISIVIAGIALLSLFLLRASADPLRLWQYNAGTSISVMAKADIDGDGNEEIAIVDNSRVFKVLRRDGTMITNTATFTLSAAPYNIAVGDVNNDGRPDFIVPNGTTNPGVRVFYYNSGTGRIAEYNANTYYTSMSPNMAAYGDFNNDGTPDIIATRNGQQNIDVLNRATGANITTFSVQQNINMISDYANNTGTDFVMGVAGSNNVYLYKRDRSRISPAVNTNNAYYNIAVGDVNNDGVEDFAFATRNNTGGNNYLYVIPGDNANAGAIRSSVTSGNLGAVYDIKIKEVTGDAYKDIIVGTGTARNAGQGNKVRVLSGASTATNASDTTASSPSSETGSVYGVEAGEVDGDAATNDIVAAVQNGAIKVFHYSAPTLADPAISTGTTNGISVSPRGNAGNIELILANNNDNNYDVVIGDDAQYVEAYTLDNTPPAISEPSPPRDLSDVNGPTYGSPTTFNISLNESAFVTVKVFSDAARTNLVATVANAVRVDWNGTGWTYSPTWDGTGSTGSGTYYYTITATDNDNNVSQAPTPTNTSTFTGSFELDKTAPSASISLPSPDGATVSGNVTIVGTAVDDLASHFLEYSVDYEQYGVGNWTSIGTNPVTTAVTNGTLATWNTTSPWLNGDYRIRLTVKDKFGHISYAYRRVTVINDITGPNITLSYFKDSALTMPLDTFGGLPITTTGSVYAKVYASELMNSAPRLTISSTGGNNNVTSQVTAKVTDYVYSYWWKIQNSESGQKTYTVTVEAYDRYGNATDNATQVTGQNVVVDTFADPTTINAPTFDAGSGNIQLTWAAVADAKEYRIWRNLGSSVVDTSGAPYWTGTATAYSDHVGTITQDVYYVAKVLDIAGNLSAVSNEVVVTAPTPTTLTLTATPAAVVADGAAASTLTAHLVDQYGNPINGEQINFATSLGTLSGASAITNASGDAAVTISSGSIGSAAASATSSTNPGLSGTTTVTFTPTVGSINMLISPATVAANNFAAGTVSAIILDGTGQPLADGTQVTFTITNGTGTFSDGTTTKTVAVSGGAGSASASVKSGTVGSVTVQAAAGGVANTTVVSFVEPVVGSVAVNAVPSSISADNSQKSRITATVYDQDGQVMGSGKQVGFTTSLGTLSAISAATDASGQAYVDLKSPTAGNAVVTAYCNGFSNSVIVTLNEPDTTPPALIRAEPSSKQIVYLTFSEPIRFNPDPPTGWSLTKNINGSVYNEPMPVIELLSSDQRIVRLTLADAVYQEDIGNKFPDPISYHLVTAGVEDLAGNVMQAAYSSADWDAYTPHGKYAKTSQNDVSNSALCGQCHSAHSAQGERLLNQATIKKVCFVCHGVTGISKYKVEAEFTSRGGTGVSYTLHKALDIDNPAGNDILYCTDCHDPHGDKTGTGNNIYPKLLKATDVAGTVYYQGNGFCLVCHGSDGNNMFFGTGVGMSAYWDAIGGDHSGGMSAQGGTAIPHFNIGFPNVTPSSGTNVTCVKCHERHGSQYSDLLDTSRANGEEEQCYKCHNTSSNGMTGDNVYSDITGSVSQHKVGNTAYGKIECSNCHGPHTVGDAKYNKGKSYSAISNPYNTKEPFTTASGRISEFCLKCHDSIQPTAVTNRNTVVPYSISFVDPGFTSNGGGWNKDAPLSFKSSGHYTNTTLQGQTDIYGNSKAECTLCHGWHGTGYDWLVTLGEDTSTSGETGICLRCHGPANAGSFTKPAGVTSLDVKTPLGYTYNHPTIAAGYQGRHSNTEKWPWSTNGVSRHAQCYDCHDMHTVTGGTSSQMDELGNISGVKFSQTAWDNWASATATPVNLDPVTNNRQAYLCYKCHSKYAGNQPNPTPGSVGYTFGTFAQTDVAKEFNPANQARHVVEGTSSVPNYGKYVAPWTNTSLMKCTDCHMSATGAKGPHGSTNRFILRAPWDPNTGNGGQGGTGGSSNTSTHLCFICHDYQYYAGGGVSTPTSSFSNGSGNRHTTHSGYGCANCHGGLPHGWKHTDSNGGGLPLWGTDDPRPYSDGTAILNVQVNANRPPASWNGQHSGSSCGQIQKGCT